MKKIFIFISFILVTQFTIGQQYFHANNGTVIPNAAAPTYAQMTTATGVTLSGSNLVVTFSDADIYRTVSDIGKSSGKWYFEIKVTATPANSYSVGIATPSETTGQIGSTNFGYGYNDVGQKKHNDVDVSYGGTPVINDVIGVLLNMTDGEISFRLNNTDYGVAYTGLSGTFYAGCSSGYGANQFTFNFGASAFAYSVPSGYNSGLYN